MVEGLLGPIIQAIRQHPKPLVAAGSANRGAPPIALTYGRMSLGKKAIMELALVG